MGKIINFKERVFENSIQGFVHRCKHMMMGEISEEKIGSLLITVLREGDDEEPEMANYFYVRALDENKGIIDEQVDIWFDDLEEEIRKVVGGN